MMGIDTEIVETVISYTVKHSADFEWTGEVRKARLGELYWNQFCWIVVKCVVSETNFHCPIFRRKEKWAPDPRWNLPNHCWLWSTGEPKIWWLSTDQPIKFKLWTGSVISSTGRSSVTGATTAVDNWLAMHGLTMDDFVPPPTDCVEIVNGEVK